MSISEVGGLIGLSAQAAGVKPAAAPVVNELRPLQWGDMVGQAHVIAQLQQLTAAAKMRDVVPGHVLLSGPRGLGKTSAAALIAGGCGLELQQFSGGALTDVQDVFSVLAGIKEGQAIFVDEIHRLPKQCHDALLVALEDFRLDVVARGGRSAHANSIQLPRFTFIAATTRSGSLAAPLRDRFALHCQFEFYTTADLTEIIRRKADKLHLQATAEGLEEIASRSRGTARVALSNAAWVAGWQATHHLEVIAPEDVELALAAKGVLLRGYDRRDVRILRALAGAQTIGLATLAALIEEEQDVLAAEHEPWLLRTGAISVTPRGRSITHVGRALLTMLDEGATANA